MSHHVKKKNKKFFLKFNLIYNQKISFIPICNTFKFFFFFLWTFLKGQFFYDYLGCFFILDQSIKNIATASLDHTFFFINSL